MSINKTIELCDYIAVIRAVIQEYAVASAEALAGYWLAVSDDDKRNTINRSSDLEGAAYLIRASYACFMKYGTDPAEYIAGRACEMIDRPTSERAGRFALRVASSLQKRLEGYEAAGVVDSDNLPEPARDPDPAREADPALSCEKKPGEDF